MKNLKKDDGLEKNIKDSKVSKKIFFFDKKWNSANQVRFNTFANYS